MSINNVRMVRVNIPAHHTYMGKVITLQTGEHHKTATNSPNAPGTFYEERKCPMHIILTHKASNESYTFTEKEYDDFVNDGIITKLPGA